MEDIAGLAAGNLENEKLVDGLPFPKTYLPSDSSGKAGVDDLVAIITAQREKLRNALHLHGALLFRGFNVNSAAGFARAVEAFGWEEHPYEGVADRVKRASRVYTANEAPPNVEITFHHEMSLIKDPCTKLFFHCLVPPPEGGETSIVRSDVVVQKMEVAVPEAMEKMKTVGIMHVHKTKNVNVNVEDDEQRSVGKSWQRLLKTNVEEEARKMATEKLWCTFVQFNEDRTMRLVFGPMSPVREYNDRRVMFNTILDMDSNELQVSTYYGDGELLPAEVPQAYRRILEENAVDVKWREGDVLLVDNLRVQHARRPGKPPRSILVSICK